MTRLALRDRLVAAGARYGMGPLLRLGLPWAVYRWGLDHLAPRPGSAPGQTEIWTQIAGVRCLTITPKVWTRSLVWLHGGGFVMGSPRMIRAMGHRLAKVSGLRVILPDYGKAPEAPFPKGYEDALTVTRAVAEQGPYALGGDSAGGTLALSVCAQMLAEGQGPRRLALASPAINLDPTRDAPPEADDMLLSVPALRRMVADYLGSQNPGDPRASPIHAVFRDPPPTLIQIANGELMEQDIRAMADHLRASGGTVTVEAQAGMPHDYQIFAGRSPLADAAVTRLARFFRDTA